MANSSSPFPALQGTPGVFDPRNPTLLPNFDSIVASGSGTNDRESPAVFLQNNPRTDATATATIGGTITTNDEITIVAANGIFGGSYYGGLQPAQLSHTVKAGAGDTVGTIAEALAAAFNDDVVAQAVGLHADVGGASGAVITFRHNGPVGNFTTLSAPTEQPSTITVGGTALTGDQFAVLFSGPVFGAVLPATADALIGGTLVAGDTVALTFTNTGISTFPITKTYTILAGDTAASVATGLTALINADATLAAALVEAEASSNVITINQQGAAGNSTVLSRAVSGSETVTFEPASGAMAGGSGQPGGVLVTSNTTTGQSATTMGGNLATAINADAALTAAGISGSNSGGVITLTIPVAAEPLTITPYVNKITPQATITGAVAAADVLNLIFTAAYLPGGAHTVSRTALLGETTTTLATNLAVAINADPVMIAAGITATSSTNHVNIAYQIAAGQIRFSSSVSPGAETVTWNTAPTETIVLATTGSETVTLSNGGVLAGGAGPIIPLNNFSWSRGGQISSLWYGKPVNLDYTHIAQMVTQGIPIA